jgi:hypothetical protein
MISMVVAVLLILGRGRGNLCVEDSMGLFYKTFYCCSINSHPPQSPTLSGALLQVVTFNNVEHASLLRPNYKCKKFYGTGPCGECERG